MSPASMQGAGYEKICDPPARRADPETTARASLVGATMTRAMGDSRINATRLPVATKTTGST